MKTINSIIELFGFVCIVTLVMTCIYGDFEVTDIVTTLIGISAITLTVAYELFKDKVKDNE